MPDRTSFFRRSVSLTLAAVSCAALSALIVRPAAAQVLAPGELLDGKTQKEWAADWGTLDRQRRPRPGRARPVQELSPHYGNHRKAGVSRREHGFPERLLPGRILLQRHRLRRQKQPDSPHRDHRAGDNTTLFFPLLSNGPSDNTSPYGFPPTNATPDELLTSFYGVDYIASLNGATLFTEIDGVPIGGLNAYRQTIGGVGFNVTYTDYDNLNSYFGYDVTLGTGVLPSDVLSASDGYYLAVKPLSFGAHTLHFGGEMHFLAADGTDYGLFSQDITYTVNVVPEPGLAAFGATAFLPLAGLIAARRRRSTR